MVIDNGSRVMRWRVLARPPGTGRDAARAELRLRAERTAYVESTGVRTDDILVVDDIAVVLPDQARRRRFPSATASCPWSRAPVTPDAERMLQDWEGQPTLEELLSGRHPCLNCGKPINADDPQIATVSWMLSRGSTVRCHTPGGLVSLSLQHNDRLQRAITMATSGFKTPIRYSSRRDETEP